MKRNCRTIIVSAAVLGLCAALVAAEQGTASSGTLEDVVIKDKDVQRIEREKPPIVINADPLKVLQPSLQPSQRYLDRESMELAVSSPAIVHSLSSDATVSPWLNQIAREPVAEFPLEYEQGNAYSWEFIIADPRGATVRRFTGRGEPPASVEWNGRDERQNFLQVGSIYSSLLYYIDREGNRRMSVGEPVTVNAALHQESKGLFVSVAPRALFDNTRGGTELQQAGKPLLDEAADILKEYYPAQITVQAGADSDGRAQAQAKAVAAYLAGKLLLPEDRITIEGRKDAPENCRIDIMVRNR